MVGVQQTRRVVSEANTDEDAPGIDCLTLLAQPDVVFQVTFGDDRKALLT